MASAAASAAQGHDDPAGDAGGRVGPIIYGLNVPPIPGVEQLSNALSAPGGMAATLQDIYTHLHLQGSEFAAHVGLSQHGHDQLEARLKLASANFEEVKSVCEVLKTQIDDNADVISVQKARIAHMEGQIDALTRLGNNGGWGNFGAQPRAHTLALDARCKTLGKLGEKAEYLKWSVTIEQMCSERWPESAQVLETLRLLGKKEMSHSDIINTLGGAEIAKQVNNELFGLLLQQTEGQCWLWVYNLRHHHVRGFEAWKEIHYGCNPKNSLRAEEIREAIIKPPDGRAKDLADLKTKLPLLTARVRNHDEVALEPIAEQIKLMGLKALLPTDVKARLDSSDIESSYTAVLKWVHALCERITAEGGPKDRAYPVPMQLGHVGGEQVDLPPGLDSALEARFKALESMLAAASNPSLGNFSNSKGAGKGNSGAQKLVCFNCGKAGHRAMQCTEPRKAQQGPKRPWSNPRGGGKAGGKGVPGAANASDRQKDPSGGNPRARAICKHFAATGTCQYSPNCRFRHVYGATGALQALCDNIRHDIDAEVTVESLGGDSHLTYSAEMDAWLLDPSKEKEIVASAAVANNLADSAEEISSWLELGEEGFQGR